MTQALDCQCSFSVKDIDYNVNTEGISDIYLFGSVQRNEDTITSDIDFLVVVDDDLDINYIKERLAKDTGLDRDYFIVIKKQRVETSIQYEETFMWSIKTDSLVLYSRDDYLENKLGLLTILKKESIINEITNIEKYLFKHHEMEINSILDVKEFLGCIIYCIKMLATCILYSLEDVTYNKLRVVKRCIGYLDEDFPMSFNDYLTLIGHFYAISGEEKYYNSYESYINEWINTVIKLIKLCYIYAYRKDTYDFSYTR